MLISFTFTSICCRYSIITNLTHCMPASILPFLQTHLFNGNVARVMCENFGGNYQDHYESRDSILFAPYKERTDLKWCDAHPV